MPYKTSRETFDKYEPTLKILLENRATHIFHTETPRRIGYLLREAIYIASLYPDLKEYTALRDLYSFEIHPTFVRARWRGPSEIEKVEIVPGPAEADRTGDKEVLTDAELELEGSPLKDKLDVCTLPNIINLSGVIEGVNRFGPRVLEVYCPDAHLEEDDLARLYRWAKEKGWTLIDNDDLGLTLTHKDVLEEIKWLPSSSSS